MSKPKKKDNKWYRKKCVELAKKIARTKAKFRCAYCGMGEPQRRTHGSHIYSEGRYKNMSADVDNILCLCAIHHSVMPGWRVPDWNWHAHPGESWEWFMEKYPELYQTLKKRTQGISAYIDFKKKHEELKKELKELTG